MKIRCLILDHDDTVVQSSKRIHYPAFLETMSILRPDLTPPTYHEYTSYCFDPGFGRMCTEIYLFDDAEMKLEYAIWKKHTMSTIPTLYPQMNELIRQFKNLDGIIAVVSHSESKEIRRDYIHHFGFEPDLVFGWDQPEHMRKPQAGPAEHILAKYRLQPQQCLMVDDMKLGLIMSKQLNIPFAAAGWSIESKEIQDFFRSEADYYFDDISQLTDHVLKK
jgi:phosphoglycolate phosphatase/pyrophosphatase PpaX